VVRPELRKGKGAAGGSRRSGGVAAHLLQALFQTLEARLVQHAGIPQGLQDGGRVGILPCGRLQIPRLQVPMKEGKTQQSGVLVHRLEHGFHGEILGPE
jgi:O-acetyl-ADP-ribose deacetylase (regulator of RNase III)